MQVVNSRSVFALFGNVTPTKVNVDSQQTIGQQATASTYPSADVVYSCAGLIADGGDFVVDITDNDTSASDAWTAGTAQVETATAAGTITGSGNASVTVTAAGMTGSPKTISVAVTSGDTAAVWGPKVVTALSADADVSALFTSSGSTTSIVLTRNPIETISTVPFYAANDATLNIAIDNGTCTGITPAATSADTTAGVATAGVTVLSGGAEDFEGVAVPVMTKVCGLLVEVVQGDAVTIASTSGMLDVGAVVGPSNILVDFDDAGKAPDILTINSTGSAARVQVTVVGYE